MSDVTRILSAIEDGDPRAAEQLLPLVYEELRKLAAVKLAQEKPGQTLQATALVHEAYLRLAGGSSGPGSRGSDAAVQGSGGDGGGEVGGSARQWNDRAHFFRAAAEAMRRVLVDNARRKRSEKRGGGRERVELGDPPAGQSLPDEDIVAVSEALKKLEQIDATRAELVKLRYFVGLPLAEAAEVLGISGATADRYWAYAKIWLFRELSGAEGGAGA